MGVVLFTMGHVRRFVRCGIFALGTNKGLWGRRGAGWLAKGGWMVHGVAVQGEGTGWASY